MDVQRCFQCEQTEAEAHRIAHENALLTDELSELLTKFRAACREIKKLKEELNGSQTPENQKVKEVCQYHAKAWKEEYPKAKGLHYPMAGVRAKTVRARLRDGFTVEQMKQVIDGAFASEFHRENKFLDLDSILRDEKRIEQHMERSAIALDQKLYRQEQRIKEAMQTRTSYAEIAQLEMERLEKKGVLSEQRREALEDFRDKLKAKPLGSIPPHVLAAALDSDEFPDAA